MADFDGDDDDFGDLYADVEAQASSAINSALCSTRLDAVEPEEGDKFSAETPCAGLGLREDGELGRRGLYWEGSGDNDVNVVDDGSESEDDFNIVLNDDDCEFRGGAREGGVGFNVDEDQKGDDDFAGLSEGNDSSKKCTLEDQLAEGLEGNHNIQIGNDRRNGVKVNSSQHYKYIRNHQPLFPSNLAPNGSTGMIAFPSMSTKCDWGDNGYNHQQGSNSGQVSRAYAKANTAVAQSGYAFWLPRYRTILDINIDTFEEKPWKYPGVDISDFFNFGFNEDSWKLYCNSLEHHRQQSSMRTWIPSYDSFKLNQVYGAGSMHEKVFQKAWVSASKSSGGQGRRSELPKGRAIQVEESSSERLPSMDMRRPKSCYSDVVIEINVQDSAEESSGLSNKELDHTTNSKEEEKPEYRDLDVDSDEQIHFCESASGDVRSIECGEGNLTRLDRCTTITPTLVSLDSDNHGNDRVSDVDKHNHAKVDVCTSTGIADTMEIEKNTDDEVCADTCDAYPFLSEAALSLEDQSLSSPALSSIGSDSEVSKGCINDNPGNIDNLLKGLPSDSGTELWESVASDYTGLKRNEAKKNLGDCEDYIFRNEKPIRQERNNPNGRLSNVADLKVRTANGDVSIVSDIEAFCDRGNKLFDCHRQKEGLHKFAYHNNQDFSSYRDTKRYPRKIGHRSLRDKMVPYHKKVWGEFSYEQRNARQDAKDLENYRLHGGRGFSSGDTSPATYTKKRNFTWRRKTDKEQFQEKAAGQGGQPHDYRNENYFVQRRYERHLQSSGRRLQNFGGRDRHRIIPPLDLGLSLPTEYGDGHWELSDHQSLFSHSYEESHMTVGRCYQNREQKHVVYDSRSSERSGRCRKQICAEEGREGDWYMRCNDSHPDESLHLGRGRYNCHSKALHWSGDNIILRQQDSELYEEGAMFLYEKKSGNRMIHTQSGTLCDKMHIDYAQLEHNRYGKMGEGNNANCFSRSFNTRCKDKHQQTGQMCGDSIDLVVGEGKPARRYSNGRSLAHNKEWNKQTSPKDSGHRVAGKNNPGKEKWLDRLGATEQNQDMDIEEGQIVTEEPINSSEEENHVAKSEGQIDNRRVLEALAKMEKRRERFNHPFSQKKDLDSIVNAELTANTEESKQQRPARKRRWGGN